jgi:hypothetical protein
VAAAKISDSPLSYEDRASFSPSVPESSSTAKEVKSSGKDDLVVRRPKTLRKAATGRDIAGRFLPWYLREPYVSQFTFKVSSKVPSNGTSAAVSTGGVTPLCSAANAHAAVGGAVATAEPIGSSRAIWRPITLSPKSSTNDGVAGDIPVDSLVEVVASEPQNVEHSCALDEELHSLAATAVNAMDISSVVETGDQSMTFASLMGPDLEEQIEGLNEDDWVELLSTIPSGEIPDPGADGPLNL